MALDDMPLQQRNAYETFVFFQRRRMFELLMACFNQPGLEPDMRAKLAQFRAEAYEANIDVIAFDEGGYGAE